MVINDRTKCMTLNLCQKEMLLLYIACIAH